MNTSNADGSHAGRLLGWSALGLLVLLVVLAVVRRSQYPDGSFIAQERTYFVEQLNPDIGDVLTAVVPGETTTKELVEKLGEPAERVEENGLELWVYVTRSVKVTERALLGLIPTGGGTDTVESQMPVGVRGDRVVHTYVSPSQDPAVKSAIESMWDAYTSGS